MTVSDEKLEAIAQAIAEAFDPLCNRTIDWECFAYPSFKKKCRAAARAAVSIMEDVDVDVVARARRSDADDNDGWVRHVSPGAWGDVSGSAFDAGSAGCLRCAQLAAVVVGADPFGGAARGVRVFPD